jgi:hypothetical protein
MPDVTTRESEGAVIARYRDEGDGTFAKSVSTNQRIWDTTNLVWVRQGGDASGTTTVSSSGGGGGAATIADGADVAQGTTTDLSSANTVIGLLKAIKAAITGTLTTTTSWASAQHVIVDTAPTTAVTGPLTDTQLRLTPVPVSGTVTTGGLTDTQLRATPVPVSGTFFQGTQPVSGSVSVSNLPATQAVTQSTSPWTTQDTTGTAAPAGSLPSLINVVGGYDGTAIQVASIRTKDGVNNTQVADQQVRQELEFLHVLMLEQNDLLRQLIGARAYL